MSSISSVSSGQGLFQFLKGLSSGSPSQSTNAAATTSSTSQTGATDPSGGSGTSGGSAPVGGHPHHHHHGGPNGGFSKIESAVTSALQSAQQDGSSSDPNKVIEDAIAKIFKSGTGASQTPTTTTTGSTSTSTGSTSTNGTSGSADATHQAFIQTLQSLGVSPDQFRQDLLAAVKDAQGGNSDPSTAFQSFPPGSGIDVTG